MVAITTRAGKGAPLNNTEVDTNFTNLNSGKVETSAVGTIAGQNANSVTITGGSVTGITDLAVADGGTGRSVLTSKNVLIGAGTSPVDFVAPGASGDVLLSDGTNWTSSPRSVPAIVAGDSGKTLINNGTVSSWGSGIVAGTAQTPTTTNADFTSIPSWVRRVTIAFSGLSTNASTAVTLRLGTGGVFATTGYTCSIWIGGSGNTGATSTTSFLIDTTGQTSATVRDGFVMLFNISGNTWVATGATSRAQVVSAMTGSLTLGGVLDSVRLLSGSGSLFDSGTVNVFWE